MIHLEKSADSLGREAIEIFDDGEFVGAIYVPSDERAIRVVSKYLERPGVVTLTFAPVVKTSELETQTGH